MHTSLVMQSTYEHIEIGFFIDGQQQELIRERKHTASKTIVMHLDALLSNHNTALSALSYVAVNRGPAPFTSLRVVIATVNGLSFACNVPLIGIDGLRAYMQEHHDSAYPTTVALFNAFNNDVYFGIETDSNIETGYEHAEVFLKNLCQQLPNKKVRFIGHGVTVFHDLIITLFGDNAYCPEIPPYPSLNFINILAQQQWISGLETHQVLPLYLKQLHYKPSVPSHN